MSEGVGGDLYDFLVATDDRYSFVIGDVVGHGLFSALVMSLLFGVIHTAGPKATRPVDITRLVNDLLCDLNDEMRSPVLMCSLFYASVHPEQQRMTYANAGHPGPLLWSRDGQIVQINPTCPLLGVCRETRCTEAILRLENVRRMLLYTDGITEARDETGRFFGTTRVVEVLSSCENLSPGTSLDRLFTGVMTWAKGPPRDDMTAILMDFVTEEANHTRR